MTFPASQFTDFIKGAASDWDSTFGLSIAESEAPDLDAVQIFSSFSASVGSANLAGSYKTFPAAPYVWISGEPAFGKFGMFGGNNWPRVCFWDAYWDGTTNRTTRGHGVAITPRHVLGTNHGGEPPGGTLQWLQSDGTTVTKSGSHYLKHVGGSDWLFQFRVIYLTSYISTRLVLLPRTLNSCTLPALAISASRAM
jgi:hypothetical protein